MQWKDTDDNLVRSDNPEEDPIMEEVRFPRANRRRLLGKWLKMPEEIPYLLIGAVVVVAIIVMLLLQLGRGPGNAQEVSALGMRLDRLQERVVQAESVGPQVEALVSNVDDLAMLEKRLKRLETDASARTVELAGKIKALEQSVAALESRTTAPTAAPQKAAAATHRVRSGDTLYSIGRQYGLSVNQLRRLNQLDTDAVIQPGQELRISGN